MASLDELTKTIATYGLASPLGLPSRRPDDYNQTVSDMGKSVAAGTVGFPMDMVLMAALPQILNNENLTVGEAFEQMPGTSDWIGKQMGVDIDSPAFILSQFLSPSPGDLGVMGAKGLAKLSPDVMAALSGIFAGRKAKTADLAALADAERMEAAGGTRDEIWNSTGWFRGADGEWRFEIDDSATQIPSKMYTNDGENYFTTVQGYRDGLSHSALSEAYPATDSTVIGYNVGPSQEDGGKFLDAVTATSREFGRDAEVRVNAKTGPGARSTALHEGQHDVQRLEDFARGGSPEMFAMERARAAALDKMLSERGAEIVGENLNDFHEKMTWKAIEETDSGPVEDFDSVFRSLYDDVLRTDPEYAAIEDELKILIERGAFEPSLLRYRRLAGEVEARNVQKRQNMTAAERRATPPWKTEDTPADQQIVRR